MLLKIYMAALLLLTLMIPFRRLVWEQIPGQTGAPIVWATLVLNMVILAYLTHRFLIVRHESKNQ